MMLFTGGNDDEENRDEEKKHMQIMNSMHSATKSLKDIYDRIFSISFVIYISSRVDECTQHPTQTILPIHTALKRIARL